MLPPFFIESAWKLKSLLAWFRGDYSVDEIKVRHSSVAEFPGKAAATKVDLLEMELTAKFEHQARILDVRFIFSSPSLFLLKCNLELLSSFFEMVKQAILEAIQK